METAPRRFSARPRTDLPPATAALDPVTAEQLARLRKRRESVLFDVQQAELALQAENPWLERVTLLDDAIAAIRAEREHDRGHPVEPGIPLPPIAVTGLAASEGPPPSVTFRAGDEVFFYEEDLDWAERGNQLARGELQLRGGDIANVLRTASVESGEYLVDHLTESLFAFASDLRDRMLNGVALPETVSLADLARPDDDHGGWLDWKSHSRNRANRDRRLHQLLVEEQRLLAERERELVDLAKWEDRLPVARRRLADVDAEIAAVGG